MNSLPTSRRITSPEDQSATFIELFFDLVFVFSVTQTVGLLHDGLTPLSVGQMVLVFWLVWWAWTQFTWALNAADTTNAWVEFGTLLATAVAFFMAVALPFAFSGRGLEFAAAYVLVRVIGLLLYSWVSWEDLARRKAVRGFALWSVSGFLAVLVGSFLGETGQYWAWGLAAMLDVVAARSGNQVEGWNIYPDHFGERHGLFVILALGETLIVAGGGLAEGGWSSALISVAVLAVAITCTFWWVYFTRAKPALMRALIARTGSEQAALARESFSLLHFPMMVGIIIHSYVIEEVVAHPAEPLALVMRWALAAGLLLYVGGTGLAVWRATGRTPWPRLALTLATAAAVLTVRGVAPALTLSLLLVGTVLVAVAEGWFSEPVKGQFASNEHQT